MSGRFWLSTLLAIVVVYGAIALLWLAAWKIGHSL